MSIHRRAAKRDGNETEIKNALKAVGASVVTISAKGVCDLLVGFRGVNYLLETKNKRGKLTPDQETFFEGWQGQAAVVRTVEDALVAIGAMNRE